MESKGSWQDACEVECDIEVEDCVVEDMLGVW